MRQRKNNLRKILEGAALSGAVLFAASGFYELGRISSDPGATSQHPGLTEQFNYTAPGIAAHPVAQTKILPVTSPEIIAEVNNFFLGAMGGLPSKEFAAYGIDRPYMVAQPAGGEPDKGWDPVLIDPKRLQDVRIKSLKARDAGTLSPEAFSTVAKVIDRISVSFGDYAKRKHLTIGGPRFYPIIHPSLHLSGDVRVAGYRPNFNACEAVMSHRAEYLTNLVKETYSRRQLRIVIAMMEDNAAPPEPIAAYRKALTALERMPKPDFVNMLKTSALCPGEA